ncbi:unnamed protein product [Vitrella brassicaformis CCMP3155]|uniref:Uncharacterized protein n=2 Tax=Vitrella brassicaformis TaxID=1169539 RepID=A0A0G4EEN7_VITBC|nr:unnamed protein product [Vitrella brassicaformis CCMP3155]|eukprot:CEL94146.1 unnamed protein product [Vitrella brassicaformis CCMP3155]
MNALFGLFGRTKAPPKPKVPIYRNELEGTEGEGSDANESTSPGFSPAKTAIFDKRSDSHASNFLTSQLLQSSTVDKIIRRGSTASVSAGEPSVVYEAKGVGSSSSACLVGEDDGDEEWEEVSLSKEDIDEMEDEDYQAFYMRQWIFFLSVFC